MDGKLNNKVAIITGATSGMGKAIAEKFAGQGASLVISGRNHKRGEALVSALSPINKNVVFIPGDVSQIETNRQLVDAAISNFGKIDILSSNAGILGLGSVTDLSLDLWHTTLNTNLSSVFYLCKYALPHLVKDDGGNIIINASIAAFKSFPNHPAYCASKAGVVALMKQMAIDYAPEVRVNAICPGPVDTPLLWESARAFDEPKTAVADAKKATLLQRLGTSADIASLVLFLASEDSSWITGTTINIDGGILNAP
jgi:NAD(P)-dependent dehydrogenase (short-subunit alcohol dehydrogenase family)